MSIRDRFEKRWPCPEGVEWDEWHDLYMPEDLQDRGAIHRAADMNLRWIGYQAAMEDAVPEPATPSDAPDHLDGVLDDFTDEVIYIPFQILDVENDK